MLKVLPSISDLRARIVARLVARWRQTVVNQIIEHKRGQWVGVMLAGLRLHLCVLRVLMPAL